MIRQTRNKTAEIKSECCHISCPIIEHPVDPNFILEACSKCKVIRSYNIITAESKTVFTGYKPWKVCKGPESSVFVIIVVGELLQLKWRKEKEELELVHRIHTSVDYAWGICYMEQFNILVITSNYNIKAVNPVTGSVVWQFTQDVEGDELDPRGVCCDMDGRIYMVDGYNYWLILLNGETGEVMQILLKDVQTRRIHDVCWTSSPPQLTVLQENHFSTYNVIEQ